MKRKLAGALLIVMLGAVTFAWAGQAPFAANAPEIPVSHRDRVYAAEQFSNTVSVTDPADNKLLGLIRLGEPAPGNFSPLYKGQLLVHGMGFSPDRRTLAVVSIGSNSVTFIDTPSNAIKHTTYVGRSPHEAFFRPDGKEVWVSVRGENYIAVLDGRTYEESSRIVVPGGPGMQIFSPDGRYAYVCSSFNPETVVISVADRRVIGSIPQLSPFCPDIAATPDGTQVWLTLKDVGKTMVFEARPPFRIVSTLDTGPITNHVNFARNASGVFAYVTVGGLDEVQVYRTTDFTLVTRIAVGKLPHGLWPSGDGSRMYVGLENQDALAVVDTRNNKVIANIPIGQAPQAIVYVPEAVPSGSGTDGLQPLGLAGIVTHLMLRSPTQEVQNAGNSSNVSLFDQGLLQVLQVSAVGLEPRQPYILALAQNPDGTGHRDSIASFTTNPSGAAIVNAVGPIRQLVRCQSDAEKRYLTIVRDSPTHRGAAVQVQIGQ